MNCIFNALKLFETNTCQATVIAVAAFVLGMVAMVVIGRICKPCGGACNGKKSQAGVPNGARRPFEKRKPHPAPADGSVEIYVGNLSYDMTEAQVREMFEKFGKVNSVRLVMNRFTGKSKGFGFVQMPVRQEADAACAALNDSEVMGRRVKCNEAKNLI